jgi:hypothetical protein
MVRRTTSRSKTGLSVSVPQLYGTLYLARGLGIPAPHVITPHLSVVAVTYLECALFFHSDRRGYLSIRLFSIDKSQSS